MPYANLPSLAYNSVENEFLVVWEGTDTVALGTEIYGQRLDGLTGQELGNDDFRISDMAFEAYRPRVAFNPIENEYLVCWFGRDDRDSLVIGEWEIYAQRLDGETGQKKGDMIRVSDAGPAGNSAFDAFLPDVTFDPTNNNYAVVWEATSFAPGEYDVFGRLVDGATGVPVGASEVLISNMGPPASNQYDASSPRIVFNDVEGEFLVVWWGDDNVGSLVDEELEIFGQRLDENLNQIGSNDFQISDMGADGVPHHGAYYPSIAFNRVENQYLTVWWGREDGGTWQLYGQRLDGVTGLEIGSNDYRISDTAEVYDPFDLTALTSVVYNRNDNEFLCAWESLDPQSTYHSAFEIFVKRISGASGDTIGPDLQISDMGPGVNSQFVGEIPAVGFNRTNNSYLVVWQGTDSVDFADIHPEIFGQQLQWIVTDIPEEPKTGREFYLLHNYPNPFNPITRIDYDLDRSGYVSLEIFNLLGEKVASLVDQYQASGTHSVVFDGAGLSSGVYIYRLRTQQGSMSRKMVLAK